jgi:hypothetical protein
MDEGALTYFFEPDGQLEHIKRSKFSCEQNVSNFNILWMVFVHDTNAVQHLNQSISIVKHFEIKIILKPRSLSKSSDTPPRLAVPRSAVVFPL